MTVCGIYPTLNLRRTGPGAGPAYYIPFSSVSPRTETNRPASEARDPGVDFTMKKYLLPILILGSAAALSAASQVTPVPLPEMAIVEQRGEGDLVVERVAPEYPADLLRAGASGKVRVELAIDREGRVRAVQVLHSADPALASAVRRAVWKWKFAPNQVAAGHEQWRARMTIGFEIVDPA